MLLEIGRYDANSKTDEERKKEERQKRCCFCATDEASKEFGVLGLTGCYCAIYESSWAVVMVVNEVR